MGYYKMVFLENRICEGFFNGNKENETEWKIIGNKVHITAIIDIKTICSTLIVMN